MNDTCYRGANVVEGGRRLGADAQRGTELSHQVSDATSVYRRLFILVPVAAGHSQSAVAMELLTSVRRQVYSDLVSYTHRSARHPSSTSIQSYLVFTYLESLSIISYYTSQLRVSF